VACFVSTFMNFAIKSYYSPGVHVVSFLWPSVLSHDRARRPTKLMTSNNKVVPDQMQWEQLILSIAANRDRAAFAQLFEYFAPRIKTFILRSGGSEARAEELAQETMLAVWRKAALFDPERAGASGWIFTIARNLRIDAHRREHRAGTIEVSNVDIDFQIDEAPLPDTSLVAMQSEEKLRSALARLSPDQIRVIELSFFDEQSHAEIAQLLNIPLGTVKSRLRLAMDRLRNLLSGGHDN
jgi:RNA polymerase sigma-70 factor, ECF subfamily